MIERPTWRESVTFAFAMPFICTLFLPLFLMSCFTHDVTVKKIMAAFFFGCWTLLTVIIRFCWRREEIR